MKFALLCSVAVAAAAAVLGCGSSEDEGNAGGGRASTILALTASATAGQSVYTTNCVVCHGTDGMGVTGLGTSLVAAVAADPSGAQMVGTLLSGVEGTLMTSFASLTDQQLADVTAYSKATFK